MISLALLIARNQPRQLSGQNFLRLFCDAPDDLRRRGNVVDQSGVLPHRKRALVLIAGLARSVEPFERLGPVLSQGPFPAGPALDKAIAPRPRHRAGPDETCRDVGYHRELRVMAVAFDDRPLEIRMQR